MTSEQKIADIKRQLGEAVNRIETLQSGQKQPLLSRLATHFKTQSGSLINVVLTASVFAVAFGKLNQKQQHEVHKLLLLQSVTEHAEYTRRLHKEFWLCFRMQIERADWKEQQQRLQLNHDRCSGLSAAP